MYRATTGQARLIAIVPAAGIGARASEPGTGAMPKQYRNIAGQPMLRHAVQALLAEPRIDRVVVAVSADDTRVHAALAGLARTAWLPCGGPTRADTVMNALAASNVAPEDWVLVHDAARPGLSAGALGALIDACLPDAVGGLLAQPVADTVKRGLAALDGSPPRVVSTQSRDQLWLAQTPQMFRASLLGDAFEYAARNGLVPTDEAGAVEALGHAPLLVPGTPANFKVTWPQDFAWMEKWLS